MRFNKELKFNVKLAEIVGIMLGDGCIHLDKKKHYHTTVVSHKEEKSYLCYTKNLFENYFNYKFRIAEEIDKLSLRNISVFVGKQLIQAGLFSGNKVENKVTIPLWLFKNQEYLIKVIRGIFDTDGCIYQKYGWFAQIQFKFGCFETTNSVCKALKKLDFNPTKVQKEWNCNKNTWAWKFYLCRQKEIDRFFKEIKLKNNKHIQRYNKIRNGDAAI